MTPNDTRERLLDAAERHFSEHGFDGSSLREITAAAGANLAAVSYHFGSKEDLFVAVVARRVEPINAERTRLLDEAERRAEGRALSVETILEAVISPVVRAGSGGPCVLRLVGRAGAESHLPAQRVLEGPLKAIRTRVHAALQRALPHLSEREIVYRMHFTMGVVKSVAAEQHMLRAMSGGLCDPSDLDGTLAQLVPFLAAGMRAPAPTERVARVRVAARAPRRATSKRSRSS